MDTSSKKTVVEAFAKNILGTRFEDLDAETVENAKRRITDVVGDILGGAGAPDNTILLNLVNSWGGEKEATILGYGVKAPAANVALVNAILCNSFDSAPLVVIIDGKRIPSHTSGATIPTAITMGESQQITGKDLIATLIVAEDLVARLQSRSPRRGPLTTLGTAAVAGRVLGLSRSQMRNAFGIALDQAYGRNGGLWDGSPTFKTGFGYAARDGIVAAQLAKRGWTGPEDPFFGEHGGLFGPDSVPLDILTTDLGKKFYVELVFKPYPGCRLTHAGIGAALAAISKHNFQTDDIAAITLTLPQSAKTDHCSKPFQIREYPTGDALFSYQYSIASTLARKGTANIYYTEEYIRDLQVLALVDKVNLAFSPDMVGAELDLKMKNGRLLSEHISAAKGDITTPLSRDELNNKFMSQVEFSQMISRRTAEKLLAMLERLEEVNDVSQIAEMAVKRG